MYNIAASAAIIQDDKKEGGKQIGTEAKCMCRQYFGRELLKSLEGSLHLDSEEQLFGTSGFELQCLGCDIVGTGHLRATAS